MVTNHGPRKVPQGLIHHWIGAIVIPNVLLDQAMQILNSYDCYSDVYKPLIRKTSVIEQAGDTVKVNVLAVQKAFSVTAAVETAEEIQIQRPAPNRTCITANSVHIQEVTDCGRPDEHAFSEAQRPG